MNKRILMQRKAAAWPAAKGLNEAAAAADRDLTAEELTQFEAHMAEASSLQARIERAEQLEAADLGVEVAADARITVDENVAKDPKGGFNFVGEFMKAVHGAHAAKINGGADRQAPADRRGRAGCWHLCQRRLGADGGFLIPPEFGKEIFQLSLTDNALLPMTDEVIVTGNAMSFPKDETDPVGHQRRARLLAGRSRPAQGTKPCWA
jgi:HK97 family phage major capsid protein